MEAEQGRPQAGMVGVVAMKGAEPMGVPREGSREALKEEPMGAPREASREALKEEPREAMGKTPERRTCPTQGRSGMTATARSMTSTHGICRRLHGTRS